MTARIVAVPGPGLDGGLARRWGSEVGIDVEIRTGDPAAVIRSLRAEVPVSTVRPAANGRSRPADGGGG